MANVTLIPYIGLLTVETRGQGLAAARPRLTLPGLAQLCPASPGFPAPPGPMSSQTASTLESTPIVPAWAGGRRVSDDVRFPRSPNHPHAPEPQHIVHGTHEPP